MVVIGYGDYKNYRLTEVPVSVLSELADRYKLQYSAHRNSDEAQLRITIAVHEEVVRRAGGGTIQNHVPTKKELARDVVNKGFQSLSKKYHPDRGGDQESQKHLTSVRSQLLKICDELDDTFPDEVLIIPRPIPDYEGATTITDDDIPFREKFRRSKRPSELCSSKICLNP